MKYTSSTVHCLFKYLAFAVYIAGFAHDITSPLYGTRSSRDIQLDLLEKLLIALLTETTGVRRAPQSAQHGISEVLRARRLTRADRSRGCAQPYRVEGRYSEGRFPLRGI